MSAIRVGTITYKKGKKIYPEYEGFTRIEVMTPSTEYGSISPYVLRDGNGLLMENIWQFSKVYQRVSAQTIHYSQWDHRVIWQRPAETHVINGQLTEDYYNWRRDGMSAQQAIRWPVGKANAKKCLYSIKGQDDDPRIIADHVALDYITARKQIYAPLYFDLVRKERQFLELVSRYEAGERLLIVEVDGPKQQSLEHYIKQYSVDSNFIENDTVLITKETLNIFLNDPLHPYGHGFCLADSILSVAKV